MTEVTVIIKQGEGKWLMATLHADVEISESVGQSGRAYTLGIAPGRSQPLHLQPPATSIDIHGTVVGPIMYSEIPFSKPTPGAGRFCGVINPRTGQVCHLMDHFPDVVRNQDARDVFHRTYNEDGHSWEQWTVAA